MQRNRFMIKIQLEEEHGIATDGTFQWIVSKGMEDGIPPAIKGEIYFMLFF